MISVIIPAYNAELYVAEAIESVLKQTLNPFEVLVINDGSTDGTLEVLEGYLPRIKLITRENKGAPSTLNEGIRLASQPLIAFLDADDIWLPQKLKTQVDYLNKKPDLEGCFSLMKSFISPELKEEEKQKLNCPSEPQSGVVAKSSLLIKRSAFDRIGYFSTDFLIDFPEWIIRARAAQFNYDLIHEVLFLRRMHRGGLSSNPHYKEEMARLLKAVIDRRRK